jgi:hypothetical protein
MSKPLTPRRQLMVFLWKKVGPVDAIRVATFLIQWGTVARALGRAPTKEEYCVHWKESQATYYRDLGRLKKVWPGEASPQAKWQWVERNVELPSALGDKAVQALLFTEKRPA